MFEQRSLNEMVQNCINTVRPNMFKTSVNNYSLGAPRSAFAHLVVATSFALGLVQMSWAQDASEAEQAEVARSKRLLLLVFERLLRAQLISNARQSRSWTACLLIKLVIFQLSLLAMPWRRSRVRPLTRKTAVPQSSQFGV